MGPKKRQPNLAAVGVACEDEIDRSAARVSDDRVGIVGGVRHKQDGAGGMLGDGGGEIGQVGAGVGHASDVQVVAIPREGDKAVAEHGQVVRAQGGGDHGGADGDVVIAENAVALRTLDALKDFGAGVGGVSFDQEVERAAGDEVSGEQNQFGLESVNALDDVVKKIRLGELFEVEVAELHDAKADEGIGKAIDYDLPVEDTDLMPGDEAAVEGETGGEGT